MRSLPLLPVAILVLAASGPAAAQDNYGGFATPSLDTMNAINMELTQQIALQGILENDLRNKARPAAPAQPATTGFRRLPAVQRESERRILSALKRRQPQAEPEYRALFARVDIARAFGDMVRPYRLSADDAADALAAYWVMAWIVANKQDLPAVAAVTAARDQLRRGFAGFATMNESDRQHLADESIFNMLVLEQARRVATGQGKMDALADATQRNFLALGTDLRSLALGPGGFARR